MLKDINIFTFINQIQTKKNTIKYDSKIASAYLLSLFLSMNENYIKKVNKINKYQFLLPDKVVYDYYMDYIPKGKVYSKFIKKRKEDKKLKDRINKIKKLYPEVSNKECKLILTILEKRRSNAN